MSLTLVNFHQSFSPNDKLWPSCTIAKLKLGQVETHPRNIQPLLHPGPML
jgi:hypothetical protein